MEKEYPLKKEYLSWLEKTKKSANNYVSDIQNLLKEEKKDYNNKDYNKYEQDFLYYTPALLCSGEREMAKELLACVYADACFSNEPTKISYFKKYLEFISKRKKMPEIRLDQNEIQGIKDFLDSRQVWVIDDTASKYLKSIGGGNDSTFIELFNIRIYSWGRPNFPLDIIKKVFGEKNKYMSDWVSQIRNSIEVVKSIEGERTSINNIKAFDFRKNENNKYNVYAIEKHNVFYTVFTPLANSDNYEEMVVEKLGDMTIDHEYPLNTIVRSLTREDESELQKITDHCETVNDGDITQLLEKCNIEKLKKELTFVRKATSYVLMHKKQNSQKSNNTPVIQVIREKGVFKYIVAEDVYGMDGQTYRVYFTDQKKQMRLEPMNHKL